jgi:hypothetical protein
MKVDDEATDEQLAGLAQAVKARIRELRNRTDAEISEAGGPANSTMTKIRHARRPTPDAKTLTKLDKGLDWQEGSAWGVLWEGRDPQPQVDLDSKTFGAVLTAAPTEYRGSTLRRLQRLRNELDRIIAEFGSGNDTLD